MTPKERLEAAIGFYLTDPMAYWLELIPRDQDRLLLWYKFGFQDNKDHTDEEIAHILGWSEPYFIERMLVCLGIIRAEAYNQNRPIIQPQGGRLPISDMVESPQILDYDPWERVQQPKVPSKPFRTISVPPWD